MANKSLLNKASSVLDVKYLALFLIILLGLYYGNLGFIALTDGKGQFYSPLLHDHFNYISWLRNSYLYSASGFCNLLGFDAMVSLPFKIVTPGRSYVEVVYDCLAINFFCFWTAFVWASLASFKKNMQWFAAGIACIWGINCLRMVVLLYAVEKRWNYNYIDHHTLFNIVAYILLGSFIYWYIKAQSAVQLSGATPQ